MDKKEEILRKIVCSIYNQTWLEVTYKNKSRIIKTFFIAIKEINFKDKCFTCDSLSLDDYKNKVISIHIYLDGILEINEIPNTYSLYSNQLIKFLEDNQDQAKELFPSFDYESILNYLSLCYNDDTSAPIVEAKIVSGIDLNVLEDNQYVTLTSNQVKEIKKKFKRNKVINEQITLGVNVLSLVNPNKNQFFVLAYKPVVWDITNSRLCLEDKILFCNKYKDEDENEKNLIDLYIYEDERYLLDEYTKNYAQVIDLVKSRLKGNLDVNDTSKLISITKVISVDIETQFDGIREMYKLGKVTKPIKAFFGEFDVSRNKKYYPFCLSDRNLNPSQILSIFSGLKDDVSFVQGPPGTGKTHMVVNLVTTAFFNELNCLVTTNNNLPMKDLKDKFDHIGKYKNEDIELPICRLSAKDKMSDTIIHMNHLYYKYKDASVNEDILKKNTSSQMGNMDDIVRNLNEYDDYITQNRIKERIKRFINDGDDRTLKLKILLDSQKVEEIKFDFTKFSKSLEKNENYTKTFLYFNSAKHLQRLDKPKYAVLKGIIDIDVENKALVEDSVSKFLDFLRDEENIKIFLDVFPIVLSTNLSASKIGNPKPYFDICITDEAGQCNLATSLIPIIRANKLVLVGDIQQLRPVITLETSNNNYYKEKYSIDEIYDYKNNSIYSTMSNIAPRCKETLLDEHYRCSYDIINFCNSKYYENKLIIKKQKDQDKHLFLENIEEDKTNYSKNTSFNEVKEVIRLLKSLKANQSVGVITPYVAQQKLLSDEINRCKFEDLDITCGTIHSFQGNEKDVIIFSTVINRGTNKGTYKWLKSNKQLINVAISRAKNEFHLLTNEDRINELYKNTFNHNDKKEVDDIYDLYKYIQENGEYKVIPNSIRSQALGTEEEGTPMDKQRLESYRLALSTIQDNSRYKEKVNINLILKDYTGSEYFDFVFYQGKTPDVVFQLMKATQKYEHNLQIKEACEKRGIKFISVKPSESRSYFDIKEFLKSINK